MNSQEIETAMPMRDIPRDVALYRQDWLPFTRLLTERLSLAQFNGGFDRLHEGKAVRQAVVF